MRLSSKTSKVIASVLVIGVAGWLGYRIVKLTVAYFAAKKPVPSRLELAARLVPSSAKYQRFLGRYYTYDLEEFDFSKAEDYFLRALQLDPHEPDIWLELASVLEFQEKFEGAEGAYHRASSLAPASPRITWPAGQFFLRSERFDEAFQQFRVVLAGSSRYDQTLFETAWKAVGDPEKILRDLIPSHQETEIAYLNYLTRKERFTQGAAVWKRILAHPEVPGTKWATLYIDRLIGAGQGVEAFDAWQELLEIQPDSYLSPEKVNAITNGNFEAEPQGFGFDWRIRGIKVVGAEYDRSVFRSPSHSVRIHFRGEANVHYRGFSQIVRVEPGTLYRFEASIRTENVTTDSGPRFEIVDYYDPSRLQEVSEEFLGTERWRTLTLEFRTGPDTKILIIQLIRRPSRKLDNLISGQIWMDDFRLVPLKAGS